jgi:GH18 family chitinase
MHTALSFVEKKKFCTKFFIQNYCQIFSKKRRNFSKESVELLNQYYFDNIDHPYPDDNVKMQLAARTGTPRENQ